MVRWPESLHLLLPVSSETCQLSKSPETTGSFLEGLFSGALDCLRQVLKSKTLVTYVQDDGKHVDVLSPYLSMSYFLKNTTD